MVKNALKIAKGTDEKRVGLNIQVPISLKDKFETFCKEHGVSMTAMMLGLMQASLEGDELSPREKLDITKRIKEIDTKLDKHTLIGNNEIIYDTGNDLGLRVEIDDLLAERKRLVQILEGAEDESNN